jgi:hypothetical protein
MAMVLCSAVPTNEEEAQLIFSFVASFFHLNQFKSNNMTFIRFIIVASVITTPAVAASARSSNNAGVPCKTYVECDRKRIQLGFPWGTYTDEDLQIDSKGCFSKNDNMFFSPGNDNDKMTRTDLPGLRIRVFCNDILPSSSTSSAEDKKLAQAEMLESTSNDNLDLTPSSSGNSITEAEVELIDNYPKIPCATMEQCNDMRKMMGIEFGTYEDLNFPTKGCFYKGDKAYFSDGSYDEMATSDLPGEQNRIYCTDDPFVQSSTTIVSSTMVSAASMQTSSNYIIMIIVSCIGLVTSLSL